jgi:hypothetical protein
MMYLETLILLKILMIAQLWKIFLILNVEFIVRFDLLIMIKS